MQKLFVPYKSVLIGATAKTFLRRRASCGQGTQHEQQDSNWQNRFFHLL